MFFCLYSVLLDNFFTNGLYLINLLTSTTLSIFMLSEFFFFILFVFFLINVSSALLNKLYNFFWTRSYNNKTNNYVYDSLTPQNIKHLKFYYTINSLLNFYKS